MPQLPPPPEIPGRREAEEEIARRRQQAQQWAAEGERFREQAESTVDKLREAFSFLGDLASGIGRFGRRILGRPNLQERLADQGWDTYEIWNLAFTTWWVDPVNGGEANMRDVIQRTEVVGGDPPADRLREEGYPVPRDPRREEWAYRRIRNTMLIRRARREAGQPVSEPNVGSVATYGVAWPTDAPPQPLSIDPPDGWRHEKEFAGPEWVQTKLRGEPPPIPGVEPPPAPPPVIATFRPPAPLVIATFRPPPAPLAPPPAWPPAWPPAPPAWPPAYGGDDLTPIERALLGLPAAPATADPLYGGILAALGLA